MTLSLGVHLARLMVGSEAMLAVLCDWAAEPNPGFRRPLDEHLFRTLNAYARTQLGEHRPEQIAMAVDMLERNPRMLVRASRNHEPTAPGEPSPTLKLPRNLPGNPHDSARHRHGARPAPAHHAALTVLARRFLVTRGMDVGLRFDALSELHHLSKHVECSQLQTFAWATEAHSDTPWLGELSRSELRERARGPVLPLVADPLIESLADRGLAEVHRHWNGSASPLSLWVRLLDRSPTLAKQAPALSLSLSRRHRTGGHDPMLADTLERQRTWLRMARRLRAELIARLDDYDPDSRHEWRRRVRQLLARGRTASFDHARHERPLVLPGAPRPLHLRRDLVGERALLYRLFRWLHTGRRAGETERAAVHAYLLVQNLVLSSLVQPVEQHVGLGRFVRDYSGSTAREASETDYAERLVQAYRTGKVRRLEVRLSPSGNPAAKVRRVEAAMARRRAGPKAPDLLQRLGLRRREQSLPGHDPSVPAVGVIFHFIRRADPRERPGHRAATRLWAPPRHVSLRRQVWKQAHGIAGALEHPRLGASIVGLDIAGLETDAPNELFAPAIRYVRAWSSRRDHGALGHLRGPDKPRCGPLRVTCHAGEDFEHLIGGMRAVDEALEFLAMEPGDRIGHGLALGYHPERWADACGGSIQHRAGPWLDDLVWFRGRLLGMAAMSDVLFEVESQITELAAYVYESGSGTPSPELLQRAWRWRMEDPILARELHPGRSPLSSLPASGRSFAIASLRARGYDPKRPEVELWQRYSEDPRVRERSREPVIVALSERWLVAMGQVQEGMLGKLGRRRVAIEINPSSNTSVGFLQNLSEHPVFRWHGPGDVRDDAPFVVVGSDDPGIFATELLHEYAFLAQAAIERGAEPRAVKRWLEELRQTSIDFCFVPETESSHTAARD